MNIAGERESETTGERVAVKHIYISIEADITNGKLLYNMGSSNWCSVTTQRMGWVGS